jgi:hypothetical protein
MAFGSIDWRKVSLAFDVAWTVGMLLLHILLLVFLGFQFTAENITNMTFFVVYVVLGVISLVCTGLSVFYTIFDRKHDTAAEQGLASALSLSGFTTNAGFLGTLILRGSVVAVLVLLTTIYVLAPGTQSAVPVYNPYTNAALTQSLLEQHPLLLNIFNIAAYPGLFEEGPIFFLINTIRFIITLAAALVFYNRTLPLSKRYAAARANVVILLLVIIIAVPIGSTLFMVAHNSAYDLDTTAKVSAFVFEALVQTANVVTGSFISWIPHAIHNALVVFKTQTAFAIGGATAAVFVIPLQRNLVRFYRSAYEVLRVQVSLDWRELRTAVSA